MKPMKLWAISDLHVGHSFNRRAIEDIGPHPEDWLILGGDICETRSDLAEVLALFGERFAQLIWIPGNHELWTTKHDTARGAEKYAQLIATCRDHGVLTPEDPYPVWQGDGGPHILAPLFLLYDYSYCPDGMTPDEAIAWAAEAGIMCVDERVLHPDPYPTRQAWCHARVADAEARLERVCKEHGLPTVLINHFPLRKSHAWLPAVPRFSVWCGTTKTEDWHRRFNANVVVYGHLHLRTTRYRDATRFEEVSLGYPRQWNAERGAPSYLREILPGRVTADSGRRVAE